MEDNLISVVVPVYNVETELPRCLDSILSQSYANIEVIVVDDGSLDGSAEVIRSYAERDNRIKSVFQSNCGVTAARLRGVSEALGEWIGFVDGDDMIEPDMYERLAKNALAYNADISHCGYQMVFLDGRVNCFYNTGCLVRQDKITALRELLSGVRIEPGLWNKLFRKTLFRNLLQTEIMPADIKINEDLLMNYFLFSSAEWAVFEDWCPYHYIVRNTSASRVTLNSHRIHDPIRVKDIIRQIAVDDIRENAQEAYINTCINVYHTLVRAGTEYRKDAEYVRNLLSKERKTFSCLKRKRAMMAGLIINIPGFYNLVYACYCRFFQKNIYS